VSRWSDAMGCAPCNTAPANCTGSRWGFSRHQPTTQTSGAGGLGDVWHKVLRPSSMSLEPIAARSGSADGPLPAPDLSGGAHVGGGRARSGTKHWRLPGRVAGGRGPESMFTADGRHRRSPTGGSALGGRWLDRPSEVCSRAVERRFGTTGGRQFQPPVWIDLSALRVATQRIGEE
jgi:hypothetical protein